MPRAAQLMIDQVRMACVLAGEPDPFDEAALLRFELDRSWWRVGDPVDRRGFALIEDGELLLSVHPGDRGRGVGAELAAAALAAGLADRAWSHGDHPAAGRLARRHGWSRARELWLMRRAADVGLPEVVVPDGVRLRGFDMRRAGEAEAVVALNAEAFDGHPEQGALTLEGFLERAASGWFDPEGLIVAEDDTGRLLGFHWTKRHSARLGEVYVVGVGHAAQGRGLGRLLNLAGLQHLVRAGVEEVQLFVESDNAAARHVYERLGFTHAAGDTHVQYRAK